MTGRSKGDSAVSLAAMGSSALLALLWLLVLPTQDIRARITFMLQHPRDPSLYALLLGLFFAPAAGAVAAGGQLSLRGLGASLFVAVVMVAIVAAGGLAQAPEITSSEIRWALSIGIVLGVWWLVRVVRRLPNDAE